MPFSPKMKLYLGAVAEPGFDLGGDYLDKNLIFLFLNFDQKCFSYEIFGFGSIAPYLPLASPLLGGGIKNSLSKNPAIVLKYPVPEPTFRKDIPGRKSRFSKTLA